MSTKPKSESHVRATPSTAAEHVATLYYEFIRGDHPMGIDNVRKGHIVEYPGKAALDIANELFELVHRSQESRH